MSEVEIQDSTEDSIEKNDESTEVEETKEPVKRKVKVDGQELEVTEEDLIRDYQLKETSYKRMQEASKLSKELQPYVPIIEALKKGDLKVLKDLGVPRDALRDFSEKELLAYIEEQEMDPNERRARDLERERDEYKKRLEQEEKTRKEIEIEKLNAKAAEEIESEIVEALQEVNLPLKGNYRLVRRMAEQMFAALESGNEKITAKQARDAVLDHMKIDFEEYMLRGFKKDPDKFLESLPKELLDGIRKHGLKNVASQIPMGKSSKAASKKQDDPFQEYMRQELKKHG